MASIIIVEDELLVASDLRRTLTALGYEVPAMAATGDDALARIAAHRPDLVLMDMMLKGPMDGVAAAARVREDFGIPVIFLTAYADEHSLQRAKLTEPYGYLIKPFEERELRSMIEVSLHRHAAQRALAERRQFEARLAQTDRLVAVGTMSAGVAHEINNPLAFVLSNVEYAAGEIPSVIDAMEQREARLVDRFGLLAVAELSDATHDRTARRLRELGEALEDARQGAERVRVIVRDLKTFSRPSTDAAELVDLQAVMESTLNLAFHEIRHRARLVRDYGPTPLVLANPSRLGQVFLNLLLNAAQAIPLGSAEQNAVGVVTRTGDGGEAVVEVSDTGAGISTGDQRSIFDPFFTTKPVGGGTGLGLSICHGIVSALGGTIEVESALGRGSTFRVTIPAAPALPPAAALGAPPS
ncbi:MAG: sensor histidine kinase, partial [Myxococcaceae bacterium]|nr:sensor histidine kinase [Myxococcaceae bacterium]